MPTIEARITKVEHDVGTGWYRVSTDHGTVKRLDTKKAEIAQGAAEIKKSGLPASLQFTSRPRTLDDGRTFENYYLDSALPLSAAQNGDSGIETITPTARRTEPGDAWRITLAASAKLAVGCLPLLTEPNFSALKRLTLEWAEFLWTTPAPAAPGTQLQIDADRPTFTSDEDIPF